MSAARVLRGIINGCAAAEATEPGGDFTDAEQEDAIAALQWARQQPSRPEVIVTLSQAELNELHHMIRPLTMGGEWRREHVFGSSRRKAFDSMLKKLEIER